MDLTGFQKFFLIWKYKNSFIFINLIYFEFMNKKYFFDNGYLEFKSLLDKSLCKKLNNKILKTRKINDKIFFENKKKST